MQVQTRYFVMYVFGGGGGGGGEAFGVIACNSYQFMQQVEATVLRNAVDIRYLYLDLIS